jgi:hypothetical protein
MSAPRHVLQLSCELSAELFLDEPTGRYWLKWSPSKPTAEQLQAVRKELVQWINDILTAWAWRNGSCVMLLD